MAATAFTAPAEGLATPQGNTFRFQEPSFYEILPSD